MKINLAYLLGQLVLHLLKTFLQLLLFPRETMKQTQWLGSCTVSLASFNPLHTEGRVCKARMLNNRDWNGEHAKYKRFMYIEKVSTLVVLHCPMDHHNSSRSHESRVLVIAKQGGPSLMWLMNVIISSLLYQTFDPYSFPPFFEAVVRTLEFNDTI